MRIRECMMKVLAQDWLSEFRLGLKVVEAKEEIIESGMPYIVARGRKGGSNAGGNYERIVLYGSR
ncbi:MAG: precorrin-8X methylmutase [Lachnospira pectinoschiza]